MILKSRTLKTLIISYGFIYGLTAYSFASTEDLGKDASTASGASALRPTVHLKKIALPFAQKQEIKAKKKSYHSEKALLKAFRQDSYKTDNFLKSTALNTYLFLQDPKTYRSCLKDLLLILSGGNFEGFKELIPFDRSLKGINQHPVKWTSLTLENRLTAAQTFLKIFKDQILIPLQTLQPVPLRRSQEAFESPIAFLAFSCFTETEQAKIIPFFSQTRDEVCKDNPDLINLLDHYSFPNLSDDPRITKGE